MQDNSLAETLHLSLAQKASSTGSLGGLSGAFLAGSAWPSPSALSAGTGPPSSVCPRATRGHPLAPVSSSEIWGLLGPVGQTAESHGSRDPPNPAKCILGKKGERNQPGSPPQCCSHTCLPHRELRPHDGPLLSSGPAHSPTCLTLPVPSQALADAPCGQLSEQASPAAWSCEG